MLEPVVKERGACDAPPHLVGYMQDLGKRPMAGLAVKGKHVRSPTRNEVGLLPTKPAKHRQNSPQLVKSRVKLQVAIAEPEHGASARMAQPNASPNPIND